MDDQSVPGMRTDELESEWKWLILRGWLPLLVRRRRYGGLLCNRALSLRVTLDARKQTMLGFPTGLKGQFLPMHSVKLLSKCGVKDMYSVDPRSLLRTEPLPIYQILEVTAPASGV